MRTPAVFALPAIVVRHRELLWSFVWRELKARYEGSLLGRLWPLLNPLILFLVYYFVFAVILGQKMEVMGIKVEDGSLMGLYIISGILPWICFSESLVRCTGVVLENGNLVKKIAFPSQLLPLYAVAVNTIYFLIGLAVFLAARLLFFFDAGGTSGLPASWWMLFPAIVLQTILTAGLGLFLGALNIFIRDTLQVISLLLQLWFFTTPIVYQASLIRDNLPNFAPFMQLNPMYHLMEMYHAALISDGGSTPWASMWIFAVFAVLVFFPCYAFFLSTKGRFADEL
ncbi:MAG: ABC transporter permease [Planctomycetes bacterium]|nr:ABC transporter permease [Planctomycetota bacterium]